jgi:hypothetical protein
MANSYTSPTNSASITPANSAANGSYSLIGQYDLGASPPHELFIDVAITASATPTGANNQTVLFVTTSIDGTNWSDAPSSTTEPNARRLGRIYQVDTSQHRAAALPVSGLFVGGLPRYIRIYSKNDLGVANAASGNSINAAAEIYG